METYRDDDRLIAELRSMRPLPRPGFAAELDARAAAGFPRPSRASLPGPLARVSAWARSLTPRQLLRPAAAVALTAVALATAIVVLSEANGRSAGPVAAAMGPGSRTKPVPGGPAEDAAGAAAAVSGRAAAPAAPAGGNASAGAAAGAESTATSGVGESLVQVGGGRGRDVERSSELVLAAEPEDVAGDAARVFEAVHAYDGIVLRSSTSEGAAGEAGAAFELLIPGAKLGDAMAALSAIDEVRARHEATADITAATTDAAQLLRESRARIDSLLGELGEAETEQEREAVEAELRREHRRAGRLATRLGSLHRRARYSQVILRIVTAGEGAGAGGWGLDDALHDAGRVLSVAAAVALVGMAVLAPVALLALLAWLARRSWLRRERRRALS